MNRSSELAVQIFDAALERPKEQRAAFLEQACGGGAVLRARVEALLRANEQAGDFMENPLPGPMTETAAVPITAQLGERIGCYKLLQQIGEGGCGVVYMAEQEHPLRRRVAVKVIKLGMDTEQVITRFEAERQALALMDHPNIAKVIDAGATKTGRPFFVMELMIGQKITDYCDERNLSMCQRLDLFVQVCRAVQHAHQKGVIHRDLKPSNILVTEQDGRAMPKVIDFGIAKATGDQRLTDKTLFTAFEQFIGTPAYMSPEQAGLGRLDIDTRSDIYSLGVLLYELLTGRPPFAPDELPRAALDQILQTIREKEPPRPSTRLARFTHQQLTTAAKHRQTEPIKLVHLIRGDLDWIVMKALEKDRARRYETATGLAMDVERHMKNEPVAARPASTTYFFQKLIRRNKLAFAAAATVAATLVLGIIASSTEAMRAKRAEQRESRSRLDAEGAGRRAEADARLAKMTLAASDFSEATRLIEAGEGPEAVPYLCRILKGNPDNRAALTRLATLITYCSWMIPTLSLSHTDALSCAWFSPDGRCVLTASFDGTARIWDVQTGQPLTGPLLHSGAVRCARFSPDGKRVVTASSDRTARVWDSHNGQLMAGPMPHRDEVTHAEFSPDGQYIVTASKDHYVRVWDAQTGRLITEGPQHRQAVNDAEFSPDGKRVVTASSDCSARVWDAFSGEPLTDPLPHGKPVNTAQFSPDGTRIITASEDNTARVWDSQSGKPITGTLQHERPVVFARFSPDGTRVLTASFDDTARIWDARTGQQLVTSFQHENWVNVAQFSRDGRRVVTASTDHTARLWDAQTGQPLTGPLRHDSFVWDAQFSPDGRRIVTASCDKTARVWDTICSPPLTEALSHSQAVTRAQFSPNGKWVVTASADATARVWDARTSSPVTNPLRHGGPVNSAQFSPSGQQVVTASEDYLVRLWDVQTGRVLTAPMEHNDAVLWAQFSPDGRRVVSASRDGTARLWDVQTGKQLTKPMRHRGPVNVAQFSPDGARVVTASEDGTARVWDVETGQAITECMTHAAGVLWAEFSPDGKRVVTASRDHSARVWDARTGGLLTEFLQHENLVWHAQFSPDGKRVVSTSSDFTAQVWDAVTGRALTKPLNHKRGVSSAQFSPDGERIVTSSWDSSARVWDSQSGLPLSGNFKHENYVLQAQFSPDGKQILTASADGSARVWDVGLAPSKCTDWLLTLAEALCGNRLNSQGILEETSLNRARTIAQIRQELSSQPEDGSGILWGRWMLAHLSGRSISPFSGVSLTTYIRERIPEANIKSLDDLEQLTFGDRELSRFIQQRRALLEQVSIFQSQAKAYANQGRLSAAETVYREALRTSRQVWTDGFEQWESSIDGLVDVLQREGKPEDAQQVFRDISAREAAAQLPSVMFLQQRAFFLSRRCQWKEATRDFSELVELNPADHWLHFWLGPLLAMSGDPEGYRRACERALDRFSKTSDPAIAERTTKICLLLPNAGVDLNAVSQMAEVATTKATDRGLLGWIELAKCLLQYRQGLFVEAAASARKALGYHGEDYRDAAACLVLAMARYQSKQSDEAQAALTRAVGIIETKLAKPGSREGVVGSPDWIMAHLLFNEAKGLMENPASAGP